MSGHLGCIVIPPVRIYANQEGNLFSHLLGMDDEQLRVLVLDALNRYLVVSRQDSTLATILQEVQAIRQHLEGEET